jgi:hypothetical protein
MSENYLGPSPFPSMLEDTKEFVRELIIDTPFPVPMMLTLYKHRFGGITYVLTAGEDTPGLSFYDEVSRSWYREEQANNMTDEKALVILGQELMHNWSRRLKLVGERVQPVATSNGKKL